MNCRAAISNIIIRAMTFDESPILQIKKAIGEEPFFAHQIGLITHSLQVAILYTYTYHHHDHRHPLHPAHSHHLDLDLRFRLTSINSTFCIYTGEGSRSTNKQTKCQSKAQHTNTTRPNGLDRSAS